jgi:signal transduction histidine kinase
MGAVTITPDPTILPPVELFDTLTFAIALAAVTIGVMFAGFTAALIETTAINKKLNSELAGNLLELKAAQDDIVRKGRMAQLGNLTATVAHENEGLGVESQIERITAGVVRCDNIITQLLDFARNAPLKLSEHTMDAWIEKVVEEEAQRIPAAVAIECHLGLDDARLQFDPDRLQRVIVNLMSNASEAMDGKGEDATHYTTSHHQIVVETLLSSRGAEIRIRDNGPGMSEETLRKIREPLFTTKNFGTGLGLPAVEKIMETHGGGMEVESAPGQGAAFTVWLPLVTRQQQAA